MSPGSLTEVINPMFLYLKRAIQVCGDDTEAFFKSAYYWRNERHQDCVNDVCQFTLHAIIPSYVVLYVKHLQQASP